MARVIEVWAFATKRALPGRRVVKVGGGIAIAVLLLSMAGQVRPPVARAVTGFTVNSTADTDDATPGDGLCDDGTTACTLRAAITELDANAGTYAVSFNIGGGPNVTITPGTPLPVVSYPATIDATTEPGCGPTCIELSGQSCGGCAYGIKITAGSSVLKGFIVNRFASGDGIVLEGPAGSNNVTRMFVGTNTSASAAQGNGGAGVLIEGSSNNIVGPSGIYSGNGVGIRIRALSGSGATGNVLGTIAVGMNGAGNGAIPNAGAGVEIDGTGTQPVAGNHIGGGVAGGIAIVGNGAEGVLIHGGMASGNFIQQGTIGEFCPTGNCFAVAVPIPNGSHGVLFDDGAHNNVAGIPLGPGPGTPAIVSAYNHGAGVAFGNGYAADDGNLFRSLTHDNDGLGIDEADTSCTPQPACRFGTVTPFYDGAMTSSLFCPGCAPGGMLAQTGYLRGYLPNAVALSDIAINNACDPSGRGEAQFPFAGTFYSANGSFTTDANGDLSVAAAVVGPSALGGPSGMGLVGMSAISILYLPSGTTGEYSNCVQVKLDSDGDGIENSVDPQPSTSSDNFDGTLVGGTAFGTIVDRGGCYVSVVPLPVAADGGTIGVVCPNNPGGQATISVCGLGILTLNDGESITGNCHSIDTTVGIGPVAEKFGGTIVATLPTKTKSTVADAGGGNFQVTNDASSIAAIDVGHLSIAPGTIVTVQDPDADGYVSAADNCPSVPNPGQENVIHPGTAAGDACEDFDSDGFVDSADNCPSDANAAQTNTDSGPTPPLGNTGTIDNGSGIAANDTSVPNGDAIGDACDPDRDNDGLPDSQDTEPLGAVGICAAFFGSSDLNTNPAFGDTTDTDGNGPSWDTDGDSVRDGVECALGKNPRDPASKPSTAACGGSADADLDGLPASAETCKWGTSDTNVDSDGDGKKDCVEANDTNGDGFQNFPGDTINSAKAANAIIQKTIDFDLNGDGFVNFPGDTILSAKMANHVGGICM